MVDQRQKGQAVHGPQCDECDAGGVQRSLVGGEGDGGGGQEVVIKLMGFGMKVKVKWMFEEDW